MEQEMANLSDSHILVCIIQNNILSKKQIKNYIPEF